MKATSISCLCGSVKLQLHGEPQIQFYCHCDDCQAVHGAAYVGVALFPKSAVSVTHGELTAWTYKTMPRERCPICATQLLGRVPDSDVIGVKANLLPRGMFEPSFHIQCQHAVLPVKDELPHYKGFPAVFGGSAELGR